MSTSIKIGNHPLAVPDECVRGGREFHGRMWENRTLITVMNLAGELVKSWHSCGLSKS